MKFLVESFEDVKNVILLENSDPLNPVKNYFVEGICIQSNVTNRNGRYYVKEAIKPEIDRYIREEIMQDKAVGELNHPLENPAINYERVSHKFVSLVESGDNWIGKAKITKGTPMGAIICGLMDENVRMGISSRALGKTRDQGNKIIVDDPDNFRLIAAGDIVHDPSAPDAYLQNLMENKEWVWNNGAILEKESQIKNKINTLARNSQLNQSTVKTLFENLLEEFYRGKK